MNLGLRFTAIWERCRKPWFQLLGLCSWMHAHPAWHSKDSISKNAQGSVS